MSAVPHHRVDGPDDAPVLLLSNSLGTDLHLWDAQVEVLARHLRVVRYDTRGHGRTPAAPGPYTLDALAADALAVLDEVGVARASIGGVSLGGMTAMAVALAAPERVDRLVLCCTSADLGPAQGWHDRAALVRADGMGAVVDAVLARWFTPAAPPAMVEPVRGMLTATDPEGYAACCEAIAAMDLLRHLGRITAPTLVIAGADDPATPPAHGEAIAAAVPAARLLTVPAAAHLANIERADVVTTAMLAHLAPDALALGEPLRHNAGMTVRRAVLGDEHVDRANSRITPFTADFQDLITRYAWGEIWTRGTIDRRMRSAVTISMMVALGHWEELGMHIAAARRNGLSVAEIREVLLQTAIYAGVPAANHAFAVAANVLADDIDA